MRTLVGLNVRLTRRGALLWGAGLAAALSANAVAWTSTPAEGRAALAETLGASTGFRALVGPPVALQTVGGFIAWRTGVFVAIALGTWGLLTTTRLLRGEEDAGRWDVVRSLPVTAASATLAVLVAFAIDVALVWSIISAALLVLGPAFDIPAAGSLLFTSAVALAAMAFAAVGAVAAQVASTRRAAAAIAGALLGLAMAVRTVADVSDVQWLRWASPLGWVSQVRAFGDARPAVLLLFVAVVAAAALTTVALTRRRDVGAGLVPTRDRVERATAPRTPEAAAMRSGRGPAIAWTLGASALALLIGSIAPTVQETLGGSGLERFVAGLGSFASVRAYLAFGAFLPLTLLATVLVATSVAGHWEEERTGRADTVLSRPVSRRRWLGARVVTTATTAAVVVMTASAAAWLGVAAAGSAVSLAAILTAGLGALPIAAVYLGVGVAAFGLAPRSSSGLAYGVVVATFMLEIVGSVSRWPGWLLGVSPFYHLGTAPLGPVDVSTSMVLLAVGALGVVVGVEAFARRDILAA